LKKLLFGALFLLIVLAVALVGGAYYAEQEGLKQLQARGITWERLHRDVTLRRFEGVTWKGVTAAAVEVDLRTYQQIRVSGVDVDLKALRGSLGAESADGADSADGSGAVPSLPELPGGLNALVVAIDDLQLRWGEQVLAEGMAGSFQGGQVALAGDGISAQVPGPQGERAWVSFDQELALENVAGPLQIEVSLGDRWDIQVDSEALVVAHPRLAKQSIKVEDWSLSLSGEPEAMTGELHVGAIRVALQVNCDGLPPSSCQLAAEMPDTPAADALAPMARAVPELRRGTVEGTLGASFTYSWPDGAWTLVPRMEKLYVEGAAQAVDSLRGGRFEYLVRDRDGDQEIRVTGEGTRGWVPYGAVAESVFQAIQSAEDASFRGHRGYDPRAIATAFAEAAEEGELGRGGSTLTQQLVKNLFLDGNERTFARKLRELLIAVELDRALGKRRILELYANIVEWGPEIYGIKTASDYYFLKRPLNLNPNEAAFLAVLLPSPRKYHDYWYMRGRASEVRVGWVLSNMADAGWLSRAEAVKWSGETIRFVPPPKR